MTQMQAQADLVFSVGLIEHFASEKTRKAVQAHFDVLRPGGIAIISFPTPTLLYRITRKLIELLGMWKFRDEQPVAGELIIIRKPAPSECYSSGPRCAVASWSTQSSSS